MTWNQCLFVFLHFYATHRSLSELEGFSAGTDGGEKVRQVTERATMFKIASDAMINVSKTVTCRNMQRTAADSLS